ncbi:ROK family protein [Burkholderia sp. MR1-5-21]
MANQTYIKDLNTRRVLTLLRLEGRLTRADIARQLGLTKSTVTYLIDDLIEQDLVVEVQSEAAREGKRDLGRPGINVALATTGAYFLGVEVGVHTLRFALLDLALSAIDTKTIALKKPLSPDGVIKAINGHLTALKRDPRFATRIRAIGVTVPGLVRSDGFVVHLPILGWREVNFLDLAAQDIQIPVSIGNNANAAAFGETYCSPRHSGLTLYLKLGNGCGGAAIINGELLRGWGGTAAEFGHMRVANDGPVCSCGRRGCLEPHVNLTALQTYAKQFRLKGDGSPSDVAQAIADGDERAQHAADKLLGYLSIGLVNLTNIFNPRDIVLGGEMLPVLKTSIKILREKLKADIVPGMEMPSLSLSSIGEYECAVGAAALAHQREYDIAGLRLAADPSEPEPRRRRRTATAA